MECYHEMRKLGLPSTVEADSRVKVNLRRAHTIQTTVAFRRWNPLSSPLESAIVSKCLASELAESWKVGNLRIPRGFFIGIPSSPTSTFALPTVFVSAFVLPILHQT